MGKRKSKLHKAVDVLRNSLKSDSELFYCYQANIAMAFFDEYGRNSKKYKNRQSMLDISNRAAKNFLYSLANNYG